MLKLYQKLPKIVFNNLVFTGIVAFYFTAVLNIPLWIDVYQIYVQSQSVASSDISIMFVVSVIAAIGLLLYAIFLLLFSWRYTLKIGLITMTLLGSMCTYGALNYGILFDQSMIRNFLETNTAEATSYLSVYSVAFFALTGLLPAAIIFTAPVTFNSLSKFGTKGKLFIYRICLIVACLLLSAIIIGTNYQKFSFVGRNNKELAHKIIPTAVVFSLYKVIDTDYFTEPLEPVYLGEDAHISTSRQEPLLMVVVLGETGRVANYQYHGYPRATNEFTSKLPVLGFNHVTSCGTATARSVPCMFSNLTRSYFSEELTQNRDNILDVLKKAKVDITWIDNQGDCKGVCDRVQSINVKRDDPELCTNGTCYDSILLKQIAPHLTNITQDTLIVLHIMGSHGPRYYERYPKDFEKFSPACSRADVENCSTDEVINAYDNTIRYTDYVIAELVKLLEKTDTPNKALLYMSDHGESLGENGIYLHGLPYAIAPAFQKEIPLQLYLSDAAQRSIALDKQCLVQRAEHDSFSHDNLFHTLLGIFDVSTKDYNPSLDMLKSCRSASYEAPNATAASAAEAAAD